MRDRTASIEIWECLATTGCRHLFQETHFLGGRDLENPSPLTRFTHFPKPLRMHSIGLCCARRPDLEDLLHQLAWVVHSTIAQLDMSDKKDERSDGRRLRKKNR